MMSAILNPQRVSDIFSACLGETGAAGTVEIKGIVTTAIFDEAKLAANKDAIREMLGELPVEFTAAGGGGWSFLQACQDRHGEQWTGLHLIMDQLVVLGIGLGLVEYCLPRDLWAALPGGMPYFMIKD